MTLIVFTTKLKWQNVIMKRIFVQVRSEFSMKLQHSSTCFLVKLKEELSFYLLRSMGKGKPTIQWIKVSNVIIHLTKLLNKLHFLQALGLPLLLPSSALGPYPSHLS